jgi:Ca2+-transporting ATPase
VHASTHQGLNQKTAELRLDEFGLNELTQKNKLSFLKLILEIIKEPMFLLLVSCCVIYIFLGDIYEALILSIFVLFIIGITIFQSWKTEKTLDALKNLASPKTRVVRDGIETLIDSKFLVPEDLIILEEGEKISADALVIESENLMVEESSLTGESAPINKFIGDFVYAGTFVTQGQAYCQISQTGSKTKLGQIGNSLENIQKTSSPFHQEISRLVHRMLIIDSFLFALVVFIFWYYRNQLIHGILTAITFAIAMIPEEIPAVLTIFMALGAWRISKVNVLTKKLSAIETLGSISVLCTDKTGTLTENKITLQEIYHDGIFYPIDLMNIPQELNSICQTALLASKEDSYDPIEQAIRALVKNPSIDFSDNGENWKPIKEYPLSKNLFAMSLAWDKPDEPVEFHIFSKGSPEAIFELCKISTDRKDLRLALEKMASSGLRVLGLAKSSQPLKKLPENQEEINFEFCGLLGFADTLRQGVDVAIQDCYSAGIKVIMMTGDYHLTAQKIGEKLQLKNSQNFITGAELESMSDLELESRILEVVIFSRVVPEQKLRIIRALQAHHQVIAMTGDGVNDAPALKASDVGIAMGQKGTEVARQSADMILLDDNFSSIVQAIKLGRRVFDNLSKAISYIIAIHIPIAGLTLIPVIFSGLPVLFFPVHVAFLELIIDPTCSIIFEAEPEANNIMRRPPKKISQSILNRQKLAQSIIQGLCVLALVLSIYFLLVKFGFPERAIRFYSFIALLLGNLCLTLVNKSWSYKSIKGILVSNRELLIIISVMFISLFAILNIAPLKNVFYF